MLFLILLRATWDVSEVLLTGLTFHVQENEDEDSEDESGQSSKYTASKST